jgi:hypothetical protein
MNYKDKIGETAYYIKDNKIVKDMIIEGRETIHLNTGSDRHGKLLDAKVQYRFYKEKGTVWYLAERIYFNKEDIIKAL